MSYDITNYAMLAISLPEFLETIDQGIELEFDTDREFLLLDETFDDLIKANIPDSFKDSKYLTSKDIAESGYEEYRGHRGGGYSHKGPRAVCAATIVAAAGIKDPVFFDDNLWLISTFANDTYVLPKVLMKHLVSKEKMKCESLFGMKNGAPIAKIAIGLSKIKKINFVSGEKDEKYTFTIPCIKAALEDLLKAHQELEATNYYDHRYYGLEYWIEILVDTYIRKFDIDANLGVVSTHYGVVHDHGGMEGDVPYVVYGDLESYDEDGWNNPREEDPEAFDDTAFAILGDSGKEFRVFTPQFGG
jgi:hypothetical protein